MTWSASAGQVTAVLGPERRGQDHDRSSAARGCGAPTAGTVRVLGLDPWRADADHRARVGVMLQDGGLPNGAATGRGCCATSPPCTPRPHSVDDLVARLGIGGVRRHDRPPALRRPAAAGGARRRPRRAAPRSPSSTSPPPAWTRTPASTSGTWCARPARRGCAVVLTTHSFEEAERLADHVVIVHRGAVVAEGSLAEVSGARGLEDPYFALTRERRTPIERGRTGRAPGRSPRPASRPAPCCATGSSCWWPSCCPARSCSAWRCPSSPASAPAAGSTSRCPASSPCASSPRRSPARPSRRASTAGTACCGCSGSAPSAAAGCSAPRRSPSSPSMALQLVVIGAPGPGPRLAPGLVRRIGWRVVSAVLGSWAFVALALLLAGVLRAEGVLAVANLLWVALLALGGVVVARSRAPRWACRTWSPCCPRVRSVTACGRRSCTGTSPPGPWLVLVGLGAGRHRARLALLPLERLRPARAHGTGTPEGDLPLMGVLLHHLRAHPGRAHPRHPRPLPCCVRSWSPTSSLEVGIVVTGGLVRLTGSGLGCPTWPQCVPGSFTPVPHQAEGIHSYIEFGNRTLTSRGRHRRHPRHPRRVALGAAAPLAAAAVLPAAARRRRPGRARGRHRADRPAPGHGREPLPALDGLVVMLSAPAGSARRRG